MRDHVMKSKEWKIDELKKENKELKKQMLEQYNDFSRKVLIICPLLAIALLIDLSIGYEYGKFVINPVLTTAGLIATIGLSIVAFMTLGKEKEDKDENES